MRKIFFISLLFFSIIWILAIVLVVSIIKTDLIAYLIVLASLIGVYIGTIYLSLVVYPFKYLKNVRNTIFIYMVFVIITLYIGAGSPVYSTYLSPQISSVELVHLSSKRMIKDIAAVNSKYFKNAFPSDTIPLIAPFPISCLETQVPVALTKCDHCDSLNAVSVNVTVTYSGYFVDFVIRRKYMGKNREDRIQYYLYYRGLQWICIRHIRRKDFIKEFSE